MTHNRFLWLVFFVVLGTAVIISGADAPILVFNDGGSMEVVSLSMERGFVVVETADGRKQQFDRRDIDLQASGLVQEVPQVTAPAKKKRMAPKLIMPGDAVDSGVLTISDQDVGHVKPRRDSTSDQDEDAEDDENAPKTIPLRISGVKHVEQDGGVTVTGTVTNDGLFDLEKTTVTGVAIDVDENNLGQGSVGLASALSQGASRNFSLIIPVTGEINTLRVSATATEIVPERPTSEGSERPSESSDESLDSQASEDANSGNNAG